MAIKSLQHSSIRDNVFYRSMLAGNDSFSPSSFDLLETQELTSSTTSVVFSGLDAYTDYKHLQVRASALVNSTIRLQMNNDTATNYSWHQMYSTSSVISAQGLSVRGWIQVCENLGYNIPGGLILDIYDFSDPNKNTTIKAVAGTTVNNYIGHTSGAWYNKNAVTSINLHTGGTLFATTRFSIYGVK